jgi:ABC-type transport system substrate-binding protein
MYIGINLLDPVLGSNRPLRQALNAGFDYPEWERFYSGRILRCDGPVPHGVDGRLETPFAYTFDLEKSRRLLAEAGYPGGIDPETGRRLTLTLSIGRASQESREAGELMAAFYDRIGIRLELSFMTWDAFLKAVNEGRVQLYRMGWVGDYPDAQNFLQLFHSANVSPGPNHSAYSNANFDREYDAAMASRGAEERNRRWRRCQEIVREDCPWVFTHYNRVYSLVRSRVRNYRPSDFPYGQERFYRVGKEAE